VNGDDAMGVFGGEGGGDVGGVRDAVADDMCAEGTHDDEGDIH
jgi:hypothetical protein